MGPVRAVHVGCAFVVAVAVGCLIADPTPAAPAAGSAPGPGPAPAVVRSAVGSAEPLGTEPAGADPAAAVAAGAAALGTEPAAEALTGVAVATEQAVRLEQIEPPGLTMAFTGDTLMHSPLVAKAAQYAGGAGYDFSPMFARVAPMLEPFDLAVCHLETPVAPPGEALSTAPLYGVPAEVVGALVAAHYDRCSTASNHTLDRGVAGIDATVAAFAVAGIPQSGMASDPAGIEPQVFEVDGVRVSHLSYTYGFNGIPLPAGQPWRSAVIDPARIIADATTARARGAQIVIVSLHWGVERSAAITAEQRSVAQAVTASGQVDLIVGHHAHVLQPIEQVNGVWVIYGLGNFISNMGAIAGWPAAAADGAIAEVRFVEQADGSYVADRPLIQPTWVDIGAGWLIRPVLADLADPTVPESVKTALVQSRDRTAAVLGDFMAVG